MDLDGFIFDCRVQSGKYALEDAIMLIMGPSVYIFQAPSHELIYSASKSEHHILYNATCIVLNNELTLYSQHLFYIRKALLENSEADAVFPVLINGKALDMVVKPNFMYFFDRTQLFFKHETTSARVKLLDNAIEIRSLAFYFQLIFVNSDSKSVFSLLSFAASGVWQLCTQQSGRTAKIIPRSFAKTLTDDHMLDSQPRAFEDMQDPSKAVSLPVGNASAEARAYNYLFDGKQPSNRGSKGTLNAWLRRSEQNRENSVYAYQMQNMSTAFPILSLHDSDDSMTPEQQYDFGFSNQLASSFGLTKDEEVLKCRRELEVFKQHILARIKGQACTLTFEVVDALYCSIWQMCRVVNSFKIDNITQIGRTKSNAVFALDPLQAEVSLRFQDGYELVDGWKACVRILSRSERLEDYR